MNAFDFKDLMKHSVMNDSIDKVNVIYGNYMLRVNEKHWILLYRRFQIISYDDVIIR